MAAYCWLHYSVKYLCSQTLKTTARFDVFLEKTPTFVTNLLFNPQKESYVLYTMR